MDAVTLSAFKYGKAGESPKVPPFVRTTVNMLAKDTGNEMLLFPVVVDEYNPHCYLPAQTYIKYAPFKLAEQATFIVCIVLSYVLKF